MARGLPRGGGRRGGVADRHRDEPDAHVPHHSAQEGDGSNFQVSNFSATFPTFRVSSLVDVGVQRGLAVNKTSPTALSFV